MSWGASMDPFENGHDMAIQGPGLDLGSVSCLRAFWNIDTRNQSSNHHPVISGQPTPEPQLHQSHLTKKQSHMEMPKGKRKPCVYCQYCWPQSHI